LPLSPSGFWAPYLPIPLVLAPADFFIELVLTPTGLQNALSFRAVYFSKISP
jgi:hypothetical protein